MDLIYFPYLLSHIRNHRIKQFHQKYNFIYYSFRINGKHPLLRNYPTINYSKVYYPKVMMQRKYHQFISYNHHSSLIYPTLICYKYNHQNLILDNDTIP